MTKQKWTKYGNNINQKTLGFRTAFDRRVIESVNLKNLSTEFKTHRLYPYMIYFSNFIFL